MPRVRGEVPNLINGISQQAASLRLSSQSSIDKNTYPLVVDGLIRRPPTRHLCQLGNADIDSNAFFHHILRDDLEQYSVSIEDDGTVRVWDHLGNEKTVTDNSGGNYFNEVTNPQTDIIALTVADHTFIVNKKKVVATRAAKSTARPYEGFVWIKQGNYGHDYKIFIDGTEEATYTVPDGSTASDVQYIRTNWLAEEMRTDLNTGGFNTSPWNTARYANTVYISNSTTDFTLSAEDSLGDRAMVAVKDSVTNLDNLPPHGKDGMKVQITGLDDKEEDDYWVEFNWQGADSSRGIWSETIAPDTRLGLDADTMPHILVREAGGGFTFKEATWNDREVGDQDSNPDPSFVGQTIQAITFHRNRLGLVTENNLILSRSGEYYNFYRSTMTQVLDNDPIDIGASHTKVSLLRHAVPYQDELILFSESTQFRVAGNELLTPKTVSARPLTELAVEPSFTPVTSKNNMYFVFEGTFYAHLYEYYYDKNTEVAEADNLSSHAPNYIPAGTWRVVAAPDLELVGVVTTGDPDAFYLYKSYTQNREKLQSAWVQWQFPGVDRICAVDFYENFLFLTVMRGTRFFTEKVYCEEGQLEAIHLDRREVIASGTYNPATDETTFTANHPVQTGCKIVTANSGPYNLGLELTPVTDGTLVVSGDYSTQAVAVGYEYESRHRFSPFFNRVGPKQIAVTDGRLQIINLSIQFSNTSYFRVEVAPEGRTTKEYVYAGNVTGDPDTVTGSLSANNGHMNVPVFSRNDRVTIDIVTDNWRPFAMNSAAWRGLFNPYSMEL